MLIGKCGCGREIRYILFRDGVETSSCNKYARCLSYDELYNLAQRRKELIVELLEACDDLHNYQSGRKHYEDAVIKYQQIEKLRGECKL